MGKIDGRRGFVSTHATQVQHEEELRDSPFHSLKGKAMPNALHSIDDSNIDSDNNKILVLVNHFFQI